MKLSISDKIDDNDEQIIMQGLLEYNLSNLEDPNYHDLGVFLKNDVGEIRAGLIGFTHGNWFMIKYLWVSADLRGQNYGSQILKEAEKTAVDRGCRFAFLDTFNFQAPLFYQKQGYSEICTLVEYPLTGKRHYFTKELT